MHPAASRLLTALLEAAADHPDVDAQALVEELSDLLAQGFGVQRATPLEVMRRHLASADLGSSQELGEEAWRAHLEWGAAKARALAAPSSVALLVPDLMDRSRVMAAAEAMGAKITEVGSAPDVLVVDLVAKTPEAVAEAGSDAGRVIGFAPHVETALLEAAGDAGIEAMPRSKLFADVAAALAPQASTQRKA